MQLTGSARGSLIVFAMKNAEGVFPSLPARNERGESWREGKLMKNGLLSPALSSFFGRRGRREAPLRSKQTTCRTVLVRNPRHSRFGNLRYRAVATLNRQSSLTIRERVCSSCRVVVYPANSVAGRKAGRGRSRLRRSERGVDSRRASPGFWET